MRSVLRRHPLLSFFALAYGLSWTWWLPLYCPPLAGWQVPFHHALGCFGPAAAAKILLWATEGWPGLWHLAGSAWRWRVDWRWWAMAALGPLALAVVAIGLDAFVRGTALRLTSFGLSPEFPAMSRTGFLLYNLLLIGFGEETGWRGYAQPRLDARYGPRTAVSLLALGWAGWHLPLFLYRPGMLQLGLGGTIGWALSILTGAALLSWLWRGTGGSLLLCAVLHATMDIGFTSAGLSPTAPLIIGTLITIAGITAFRRLPATAPTLPVSAASSVPFRAPRASSR